MRTCRVWWEMVRDEAGRLSVVMRTDHEAHCAKDSGQSSFEEGLAIWWENGLQVGEPAGRKVRLFMLFR